MGFVKRSVTTGRPGVFRYSRGPESGSGTFMVPASGRGRGPDPTINSSHELFDGVADDEVAAASRFLTVVDVAAGTNLGDQGQPCREFTLVFSGQVGVSVDSVPIAVLGEGSWFGALPLLDRERHTRRASFHAVGPARIAVADPREFTALLAALPVVAERLAAVATRREAFIDQVRLESTTWDPAAHEEYPTHAPA